MTKTPKPTFEDAFEEWFMEQKAVHTGEIAQWGREYGRAEGRRDALESGAVAGIAAALSEILEQYEESCCFDHNNNCQEHLCFGGDGTCYVEDAKNALAAFEKLSGGGGT